MADQTQDGKLQVRLVTPDRELVDTAADAVELPGRTGYLEVLYGAAPLLTELGTGLVSIHGGGEGNDRYYVAWGFAEVLPEKVTILAETAEKAEEIDTARAEAAKRKAEAELAKAGPEGDKNAQTALERAQARIAVASTLNRS